MTGPDTHDPGALGAYLLGRLDADDARRLEAHLASCARCRAECDELRPAVAALTELKGSRPVTTTSSAPPSDLGERIVGSIDLARRREKRHRYLRSRYWARRPRPPSSSAASPCSARTIHLR